MRNTTVRWRWFLASLVWCFANTGICGDRAIKVTISNTPDAPAQISEAGSELAEPPVKLGDDTASRSPVKALRVERRRLSPILSWEGWIKYGNRSKQPITAIKVRWEFWDAFDEPQWAVEVSGDQMALLPGEFLERRWEDRFPRFDITKALVTIETVRFADGTMWQRAARGEGVSQPLSEISEVTRLERQRLLDIYRREGLDALLEVLER